MEAKNKQKSLFFLNNSCHLSNNDKQIQNEVDNNNV